DGGQCAVDGRPETHPAIPRLALRRGRRHRRHGGAQRKTKPQGPAARGARGRQGGTMSAVAQQQAAAAAPVTYDTHPDRYAHWKLALEGEVATLSMDVNEEGGLRPGYRLKLNSYDLGVDIELHDALNRIRFEHPEVKCVVITSARERMF